MVHAHSGPYSFAKCECFNGHEVNEIHELYGKKGCDEAHCSVNNGNDFTGIHDLNGNFHCHDFFCKTHALTTHVLILLCLL